MPKKPPSDRTRAKGGPPSPEFWILTSGFSPNMRNKPNFGPTTPLSTICYLLSAVFNKTNPISAAADLWRTKKYETNPIPAYQSVPPHTNYAKRTQFPPWWTCGGSKKRNEPNFIPAPPTHDPNIRNKPNSPRCHPERRAAERSAAAQSRGTCSITIADLSSVAAAKDGRRFQTNKSYPHPKKRNEPNLNKSNKANRT